MRTLTLFLCISVLGMAGVPEITAQPSPADAALYGPYPKEYKEIVTKWLQTKLIDAGSARIDWLGDPQPADLGKDGQHLYGYLVKFKVNSRNQFGTYTGWQEHGALIRDGNVIKGLGLGY